jgi:hypothetical protein
MLLQGPILFQTSVARVQPRHRRQDRDSRFMRISEALMLGAMKLEIIARWLLTYEVDPG